MNERFSHAELKKVLFDDQSVFQVDVCIPYTFFLRLTILNWNYILKTF